MLYFDQVCKAYGDKQVLDRVSARLPSGVFALRGPNGIGKSTLLAVLSGAVEADSGAIWIDQQPLHTAPAAARARLGYAPDECPVYPFMTGRELLALVASAKRCALTAQVTAIVARFGLERYLDTRCGQMSLGTQKKLMLAAAWIGTPAVLLFDEPSNGLDMDARAVLIDLLAAGRASTVALISTHDHEFSDAIGATRIELADLGAAHTP
ncbi:ABC transporter ATP-binding protein [Massilia sp. S19_KUP03_FR1]|uniref:ABC transporter ATP-binding protein n=1 Tax=Massilia sp. S19_KUP03_FR1 TaxID=3025503 RepID=UPI002FCD8DE4